MTQETKPLPKIARRAIALVNAELQTTIMEAAELIGLDLKEGWQLDLNTMAFVRPKPDKPEKSDAG